MGWSAILQGRERYIGVDEGYSVWHVQITRIQ